MKTSRLLFPVPAAVLAMAAAHLSAAGPSDARTQVVFDHPDSFTDVKDADYPTERGRDAILATIREHVVAVAAPLLPSGDALTVTFTDIDLAGDFEPWRGPSWADVRIVKSVYPPDFKFTYSVVDVTGRILLLGREDLRDNAFQYRVLADVNDPLRYEKQILGDWIRSTLRGLKRS